MSERKRLIFTAIAVALVGIVTGLLLGGSLLPSQAADQLYNERETTETTEQILVHTHDGNRHEHRIITVITTKETTPHTTFHALTVTRPTTTTPTTTAPAQAANEVFIIGSTFMPGTTTVPVGTTVTWTNQDNGEHTVTSNTGLFDTELFTGESSSYTFTEPGTFDYHCIPHSGMIGQVVVE